MCCSLVSDVDVDFSNTIIYAAETIHPDLNRIVHVLGYQNTVQNNISKREYEMPLAKGFTHSRNFWNLFGFLPRSKKEIGSGNAMLLPFPAKPGTMSSKNVIDTEKFTEILTDISRATYKTKPDLNPQPIPSTFAFGQSRTKVEVFEVAGIYTVVLAQNAKDIPEALKLVPLEKRPNPNPEIFKAYSEWYPNWTFALCCFNNEDKKEAHPMLWWYEPMFEEKLFLPTVDSHNGMVPELDKDVRVEHTLAVGSKLSGETRFEFCYEFGCVKKWKELGYIGLSTTTDISHFSPPQFDVLPNAKKLEECPACGKPLWRRGSENSKYQNVDYRSRNFFTEEAKVFLMDQIIGQSYRGEMKNGDFFCDIEEVRKGIFNPIRQPPNKI